MTPRTRLAATIATAIVLGGAASVLLNESFQPFSARFILEGREGSRAFTLPLREPLFLEYELVVRADGRERPPVVVTLNGHTVPIPSPEASFSTAHAIVPVPFDAVRDGDNLMHVAIGGAEANTFEMHARLHNYYGIAPDFPRAAVVGDQSAAHRSAQMSFAARLGRLAVLIAIGGATAWLLLHVGRPQSARGLWTQLAAVILGPVAALTYSIGQPLHLWLSPEALATLSVLPWTLVMAGTWLLAHRVASTAVALLTAVTLLMLEGGLRAYNYFSPTFVFYSESYSRYRGQPGALRFDSRLNSRGFNDEERSVDRPAHVAYRVLALGDSFAVGVVPRSANYLTLLESLLSTDAPTEVINMGVSGTEPRDYLSILVDEGLAYRSDLVLVHVFIGNDFETRAPRWHDRSYVATLVRALWQLGRSQALVATSGGEPSAYVDDAPGMSVGRFMEVQVGRAWVFEPGSARLTEAAGRAADLVRQIRDLALRGGAETLVVLIPDETQVDAALRANVALALDRSPDELDIEQPNRVLTHALEAGGIDVLDLLPALVDAAARQRVYKPRDTHWNLAGNRVAAEVIARTLAPRVKEHLSRVSR